MHILSSITDFFIFNESYDSLLTLMTNLLDAMIGQRKLVLQKYQLKAISTREKPQISTPRRIF